ncbi:winged helix-turn-helix transcriptional regulator [Halorubrum ezzemoulense]|nr:winged helix-turn-helix transcriptional regulator [Halorubrum ezzemoulense]
MKKNATDQHRGIAVSNEDTVTYPAPILHGLKLQGQLNDDNRLYEHSKRVLSTNNTHQGKDADKDCPHRMARKSFSWTNGQVVEVGLFSSSSQYGTVNEGEYIPVPKLHINCYADAEEDIKADVPAKLSIVLEKRVSGLQYEDENEFTWPGGWDGETHVEGTFIQIQSSYGKDVWTLWCRAFELLSSFIDSEWLSNVFSQTVFETLRVGTIETHHRHDRETLMAVNEMIGQAGSLLVHDGEDCSEVVLYERGHSLLHRVQSSDFQLLGFRSEIDFTYRGQTFTTDLNDCAVKTYEHKAAKVVSPENPLAHPKTESILLGWFPAPALESLVQISTTILHAFLKWSGIECQDFIGDDYYSPEERPPVTTRVPTEYMRGLRTYYESEKLRHTLIGELYHKRTKSKFDIIASLLFSSSHSKHGSSGVTYQALAQKTGLAQETLRKHVRELENLGVVKRMRSGRTFIAISRASRDMLRKLVVPSARNIGDVLSKVKERASIRRTDRDDAGKNEAQNSVREEIEPNQLHEAQENWQCLTQTEYEPEEIMKQIRTGRLSPDDIFIRK